MLYEIYDEIVGTTVSEKISNSSKNSGSKVETSCFAAKKNTLTKAMMPAIRPMAATTMQSMIATLEYFFDFALSCSERARLPALRADS